MVSFRAVDCAFAQMDELPLCALSRSTGSGVGRKHLRWGGLTFLWLRFLSVHATMQMRIGSRYAAECLLCWRYGPRQPQGQSDLLIFSKNE